MLPPTADADQEDPTTQIAWPNSRRRESDSSNVLDDEPQAPYEQDTTMPGKPKVLRKRLSTWDLITLSISMLGAQIVWTVELGYGTPFLLSLGISEQLTALVWLAGPISGLIAQPVIGAVSDSSTSKYRRRYWIILATVVLVVSTLVLAYCEALAAFFVDLFQVGAGDWDEKRTTRVANTAICLAIVAFYLLDFALNGLQASLRNLLLDVTPASQLNAGNAWHGRMTHAGNIIGFGFGFLPLAKLPFFRLLGGTQFRKFCILCIIILVITVWTTCALHEEQEREKKSSSQGKFREIWNNIKVAVLNLPKPIRRVCYVQFFAFMGWFPFLFYSTTYVGQVMALELGREPDPDLATRTGEFAMLLYSIVAVIAGTILPHLANRDRRLMAHKDDVDEDAELTRIKNTVRQWKAEAARNGKPLRLPMMPFLLRNIWTGALLWFSVLTMSTFFVKTVTQATVFIALVGVCWAVAMWAPFAIIMELLKELSENNQLPNDDRRPLHSRTHSTPGLRDVRFSERQPLLRRRSLDELGNDANDESSPRTPVAGGTILGVHNLAIVMPQFVVAVVTSIIFRIADGNTVVEGGDESDAYFGKNGVAWVLRFGGVCTLVGAVIARMVPPTPTEKAMRRRLGDMRDLKEEMGA
ncbi:MFS general substrate transporter [Lentinula lateritia]|uniref:MFS general substrate transporter n=1 Tax=Lentinula lateritia TaxID=40482 RepID=A0ABQ8VQE8_9AGAR|nr:MFS general substrate transporter [Lentinula lateritia]